MNRKVVLCSWCGEPTPTDVTICVNCTQPHSPLCGPDDDDDDDTVPEPTDPIDEDEITRHYRDLGTVDHLVGKFQDEVEEEATDAEAREAWESDRLARHYAKHDMDYR